ncbi:MULTISPECIES: chorismate mutase [Shimia]|uniref:chorismate mutase n=1 Tax=Shimia TaxID=573139 RepID=UPI001FB4098C|nr:MULTISPECIES: chorismate mutase [Shimia]MDV4145765.1 chorismate mutase [Shimia sp. FJ5]
MTKPKSPGACDTMQVLRGEIDDLDRKLISLLALRAGYIDRAIEIKAQTGLPARIPDRVEDVVTKVRLAAEGEGLDPDLAEGLWRDLIEWSIAREARQIGGD